MKDLTKVDELLADALLRVGSCEGITSSHNGDEDIAIKGGHFDDYILMTFLGLKMKENKCEFKISPSEIDYLCKLLHIKDIDEVR